MKKILCFGFFLELNFIYFTMIDKQVLQLISILICWQWASLKQQKITISWCIRSIISQISNKKIVIWDKTIGQCVLSEQSQELGQTDGQILELKRSE